MLLPHSKECGFKFMDIKEIIANKNPKSKGYILKIIPIGLLLVNNINKKIA